MRSFEPRTVRQTGFSIIEAMIAMLIMGIGVLALVGLQAAIGRTSEDARHRTEAIRFAEEKIESLRSFTGISSTTIGQGVTSTTAVNWVSLSSGTETLTGTNGTYTRQWSISGSTDDPMRNIQVTMSWTNRAGEAQTVSVSSILSKSDPADAGFLAFPLPLDTNLKRPKDRNLDIPIRATDLGTGDSALQYGDAYHYIVFSNVSGDVIKVCSPNLSGTPTDAQVIAALTSNSANCSEVSGYIVAGYIARDMATVSESDWVAIKSSLGVDTSALVRNAAGSDPISCQIEDAVNQNTGAAIANFKSYLCVIPLAAPSPALVTNGPFNWSGTLKISGSSGWSGGSSKYYICRYQYTQTNTFTDPNQRNVQPYAEVNKSIDQQNYVLAQTDNASSNTAPACPSHMTVSGVSSGILHQDCRGASNPNFGTACPVTSATIRYSVAYNGNGNTSGTAPTDSDSPYVTGSAVSVKTNSGNLAKTGYAFGGWNTSASGTGTSYGAGDTFILTANTTLYARWISNTPVSITYVGNGNTGGSAPVDANNPYTGGSSITIQSQGTLAKTGAVFSGWNSSPSGSGVSYSAGSTTTLQSNLTLYAQWANITTLATPVLSWQTPQPATLTWSAVSGATGYEVRSCVTTNNNSLTPCTPTSPITQTSTSKTTSPSNKDTLCYTVKAIGVSPYQPSAETAVACIHFRSGAGSGTYTTQ